MTIKLKETIKICDKIFENCDIDFDELMSQKIDIKFFDDYKNTRIVNSFLFNFSKLQDKIGAKLFRNILFELKELDDIAIPMIDVLNHLEKLKIIDNQEEWESLREIRNILSHEYLFDTAERIENINLALEGYIKLKSIYAGLKDAIKR
jgi:hypothetical protein